MPSSSSFQENKINKSKVKSEIKEKKNKNKIVSVQIFITKNVRANIIKIILEYPLMAVLETLKE